MLEIVLLNINNITGDCAIAIGTQPTFCNTDSDLGTYHQIKVNH